MTVGLDWSGHRIGPLRPCRICGRPALMRDDQGAPCHKVCAEATADTNPDEDETLGAEVLPLTTAFDLTTVRRAA